MGNTLGMSFTSKKAYKKPQEPAKGATGEPKVFKQNAAPKHDKSYNHNTQYMKKSMVSRMSERAKKSKAYLS